MTSTDSNIKIISPFLEGITKCFDFAGFFNDIKLPVNQKAILSPKTGRLSVQTIIIQLRL